MSEQTAPPQTDVLPAKEGAKPVEQMVREKSLKLIDDLDKKNGEAIRGKRGRIGYAIGDGEKKTFILSQPVTRDVQTVDQNGQPSIDRQNYRVFITPDGPRAVWFSKGKPGANNFEGRTPDEFGENGESIFQWELDQHADKFEKDGEISENYTSPNASGRNAPTETPYKYIGINYGFSKDQGGIEYLSLEHHWNSTDAPPQSVRLLPDVPEDVVKEAFQRSLAEGKKAPDLSKSVKEKQAALLDDLLGFEEAA